MSNVKSSVRIKLESEKLLLTPKEVMPILNCSNYKTLWKRLRFMDVEVRLVDKKYKYIVKSSLEAALNR